MPSKKKPTLARLWVAEWSQIQQTNRQYAILHAQTRARIDASRKLLNDTAKATQGYKPTKYD